VHRPPPVVRAEEPVPLSVLDTMPVLTPSGVEPARGAQNVSICDIQVDSEAIANVG